MKTHSTPYRFLLLLVVVSILPLAVFAQSDGETELIPAPTGPYMVGTISRYFMDSEREEDFTTDTTDKRELMVQFWYPAEVEDGAIPEPYMPHSDLIIPEFNAIFSTLGIELALSPDKFAVLQSHASLDALPSEDQSAYPVLMFSHGWTSTPIFFSSQLEEMASHGYVVAAINHTYASTATVFPDGREVTFSDFISDPTALAQIAAEDQIFIVNQLEVLNADDILTGRLNLEQLGSFGQSMGGNAATFACYLDSRFDACINEDGFVEEGDVVREGLDQPFMFMHSENYPGLNDRLYQQLRGPAYSLIFNGLFHVNFSDLPLWPDIAPLHEASLISDIDEVRSIQLTNAYVLAFFDKYLKGENEPLLDGPSPDYPEVDFQARNT
jgi:hypothetical protein